MMKIFEREHLHKFEALHNSEAFIFMYVCIYI